MHTPETIAVREALATRRVALVHDWLTGYRGGEKVLAAIAELVPHADLYTLIHVPGSTVPVIEDRRVYASPLNRLPGVAGYYRWLLSFFPTWADHHDLADYDLVLSTSHCVAKSTGAEATHLCYCHTPMRYVWDRFDDYFGHHRGPMRWLLEREAARLRAWDRRTADRVDHWMANSHFVRDRIVEFYGVDPSRVEVLPPPVEVDRFAAAGPDHGAAREDRYLVVSALVPYKRIDHAVEACARSGRRLDVAGTGPEAERLVELARRHDATDRIRFLGFVSDADLPGLMASRRAMLFPGVEDFGITPVEATAAGLPVIARGEGGALDTIREGVNGLLYSGESVDALVEALDRFETAGAAFDPAPMREWAAEFSRARFVERYVRVLREHASDALGLGGREDDDTARDPGDGGTGHGASTTTA